MRVVSRALVSIPIWLVLLALTSGGRTCLAQERESAACRFLSDHGAKDVAPAVKSPTSPRICNATSKVLRHPRTARVLSHPGSQIPKNCAQGSQTPIELCAGLREPHRLGSQIPKNCARGSQTPIELRARRGSPGPGPRPENWSSGNGSLSVRWATAGLRRGKGDSTRYSQRAP